MPERSQGIRADSLEASAAAMTLLLVSAARN